MLFGPVFESFAESAPFCTMTQSLLENIFSREEIDRIFEETALGQYTRDLTFSTVADLMCDVVLGAQPSIHAAFTQKKDDLSVSITSIYNKLNGTELGVSETLVEQTAARMGPIIGTLGGHCVSLLDGYRVRILDGNHLAGTEHRIEELRSLAAAPLPGKSLVVYEPASGLMTHMIGCEDGHAQERSLIPRVLELVETDDLWIEDRNFCTTDFLFGIHDRGAAFIVRQHKANLVWERVGKRKKKGRIDTGTVYEQKMHIHQGDRSILIRRITLVLDEPTRDGETEIHILTNLKVKRASALKVAELYRHRWKIETAFQALTRDLCCEIHTLGYPRAALFGFALAVVAYNIYSVAQSALRAVHGPQIDEEVSRYHLANEVRYAYGGMMIAVPTQDWRKIADYTPAQMAAHLKRLAKRMDLSKYPKSKRQPKKPPTPRVHDKRHPHVSTFRVLQQSRDG